MLVKMLGCISEFTFIRYGQNVLKKYFKFESCEILLHEFSTNTMISISEEKIANAKEREGSIPTTKQSKNKSKLAKSKAKSFHVASKIDEDPRVFKRMPMNIGLFGMVMRDNKLFVSNNFSEDMLYDEKQVKFKIGQKPHNPCSIMSVPIFVKLFPNPIGVIQLMNKVRIS